MASSPDGKYALTGSIDKTAILWEVSTSRQLRRLNGHADLIESVAFSPDGKQVLTGSEDKTAILWEAATGRQLHQLKGHASRVSSVAFSPDGKQILTGSWDDTAIVWETATGRQLKQLKGHTNTVQSVAFSRDGKRILTGGGDRTGIVWDADTGKQIHHLKDHENRVPSVVYPGSSVAFSPDGKQFLTRSVEKTAIVLNAATGEQLHHLKGHADEVWSVAFSPDGKQILTGGADKTAIIWDAATGKQIHQLKGHDNGILSVAYSPDAKCVLTGSWDKKAVVWDAATGKQLHQLKGHALAVNLAVYSPDGKQFLSGGQSSTAILWDGARGKQLYQLKGHEGWVWAVAFSPDGKQALTRSEDETAIVWDAATGKQLHQLKGHNGEVNSVVFSPNGKLVLTGNRDGTAIIWDAATGKQLRQDRGHSGAVRSLVFSPDGKLILSGSADNTAIIWDAATGKQLHQLKGHNGEVWSVAFSFDGKHVLTGGEDRTVIFWDAATGKQLHQGKGHAGTVWSVAFSPDSTRVLTGSEDGVAILWEAATGKQLHQLKGHEGSVWAAAFSPDSKHVLTSGHRTAIIWDAASGKQLHHLKSDACGVMSAVYSPNGKHVLTGNDDRTIRLWDTVTGRELCRLISFTDGSWAVVDAEGRYDASDPSLVEGLHWVVGMESIALEQLRRHYHDPGLLAKHLGFDKTPLLTVAGLKEVKLYPEVAFTPPAPRATTATLALTNRGGGIGPVRVFVNNNELPLAARRGPAPAPDAPRADLVIDLSQSVAVVPGKPNEIRVVPSNADQTLQGRGMTFRWTAEGEAEQYEPELYAIVCGVSEYANKDLNLRYAAKDAEDFAAALRIAGERFFGTGKVHLTLLTTSGAPEALPPTRENLEKAFSRVRKARPDADVLVVYLAGHGAAVRTGAGRDDLLYCFATRDATSISAVDLADRAYRERVAVTSEDLRAWIQKYVPARRQVLILDTCAAGAATKLTEKRDVPPDQKTALLDMKERTGVFLLMGSSADRVSYESSEYGQGLLTYSLLFAMKGAAREYVDVLSLFRDAADQVPRLAQGIGGVQTPLVSVGEGGNFPIGRLTAADKEKIPLAAKKPLILRPSLLNAKALKDDLKLAALLANRLAADSAAERGRDPDLVYVPEEDFPGAVRPTGLYTVDGNAVTVRVVLERDGKEVAQLEVKGTPDDLPGLAVKLAKEVRAAVRP